MCGWWLVGRTHNPSIHAIIRAGEEPVAALEPHRSSSALLNARRCYLQVCSRTVFLCIYMAGAVGGGLAHHMFGSPHTYVLGSSGEGGGPRMAQVCSCDGRCWAEWVAASPAWVAVRVCAGVYR